MKKGHWLYSILNYKCPKCHEGDLYPGSAFEFSKLFTMNEKCSHCGQEFELEPGFYWGSMYVAYGLASGIMLTGFAILYFFFDVDVTTGILIVAAVLFLFYAWVFRTARAIWINIYVNYDKQADEQPELYKSNH
ncbi:MAG TPA: DUF983 domain-containing protein [Bacteroidales bacterium]|nr:DUF983 domain-containing protein [Bacteroidales bacterium]